MSEGGVKTDARTRQRAKALRRDLTKAERILWSRLKGRRLDGWQFRTQHPVQPYILDFACVKARLAIEVDGETHSTASERAHDARRTARLADEGWTVLRFWNFEIYRNLDGVMRAIRESMPPRNVGPEKES